MTNLLPILSQDLSLSKEEIGVLCHVGQTRHYAASKVVFRVGDRSQEMFVVESGEIELQRER